MTGAYLLKRQSQLQQPTIYFSLFFIFQRKQVLTFYEIVLSREIHDSHEMSKLVFSEKTKQKTKKKKKKKNWMSTATIFAWGFKG